VASNGLMLSKVAPSAAGTHLPAIWRFFMIQKL
jgi:hypothetical protein